MENVLKISLSGIPNILPNRKTAFSLLTDKDNVFKFNGKITESPVITAEEWKTTDYKETYNKMLVQNVVYRGFELTIYTANSDSHNLLKLAISAEIETDENNYSVRFESIESEPIGVFHKVIAVGYVLDLSGNNVIDYSRSDKILADYGTEALTEIKVKSNKIIIPCNLFASPDITTINVPTIDRFTFQKVTNGESSNVFLYLPITDETTAIVNSMTATNTELTFTDKNNYFGVLYLNYVSTLSDVYKLNIITATGVWQPDSTVSSHAVIECNVDYEANFYTKILPKEKPVEPKIETIKSNSSETPVSVDDGVAINFKIYLSDADYAVFSKYINRARIRDINITTYTGATYSNSDIPKITVDSSNLQNSTQLNVSLPVDVSF